MATTGTKLPGLKPIPAKVDKELAGSLKAMQEALAIRLGQLGDPLDRAVTLRELVDSGLAKTLNDNPFDPNAGVGPTDFGPVDQTVGDLSTPPAPVSLTASPAFTSIILDWNGTSATAPYGNHAYTEIWRSRDNNLAGAVLRATTNAFIYTDEVGYNETYYYWVRYVSTSNVQGPFNNTNGVEATTLQNISAVMADLSETLANMPGYSVLTSADTTNATNIATVSSNVSTLQTTVNSHASTLTSHTSSINSNTSSVTSLTSTTASHTGDLNAMFVLQASTESNGSKSVAGMVIGSNASDGAGAQSHVQFLADKFAIWNGTNAEVAPFIVSGGSVFIDSARIQDGAITNARIANATIETGKIANAAITTAKIGDGQITTAKIGSAQITTALIGDAQVTNAKINDLNATKITAGFINAARIDANTITADKINVTNLVLPISRGTVSSVGPFNNNTMRLIHVADIGTATGIYSGYVRIFGSNGQVKTLSVVIGDGSYGAGSSFDLRSDFAYANNSSMNVPIADSGSAQYHSGQSQFWSAIDRFNSTSHMVQLDVSVRKTSSTSSTMALYILAQGDGNFRFLSSVQFAFYRFSEA